MKIRIKTVEEMNDTPGVTRQIWGNGKYESFINANGEEFIIIPGHMKNDLAGKVIKVKKSGNKNHPYISINTVSKWGIPAFAIKEIIK